MSGPVEIISAAKKLVLSPEQEKMPIVKFAMMALAPNVQNLKDQSLKTLKAVHENTRSLSELGNTLQAINSATIESDDLKKSGGMVIGEDSPLKDLLHRAADLGVKCDLSKTNYTKAELNRLIENIRITKDHLVQQNSMDLQKLTRLHNELLPFWHNLNEMRRTINRAVEDSARKCATAA